MPTAWGPGFWEHFHSLGLMPSACQEEAPPPRSRTSLRPGSSLGGLVLMMKALPAEPQEEGGNVCEWPVEYERKGRGFPTK